MSLRYTAFTKFLDTGQQSVKIIVDQSVVAAPRTEFALFPMGRFFPQFHVCLKAESVIERPVGDRGR